MEKKKDPIITLMRSVAIILVVLQHALKYSTNQTMFSFAKVCYAIDVNVFFFISGIYLKERKVIMWVKIYPDLLTRKQKSF